MNSVSLKEVCDVFGDGDWIESKDQSDGGIRLIQTGNVGVGVFKDRIEKARWISEDTFKRLRCTEIREGDVLISRLPDPVGRSCLIPALEHKAITAVDCSILRFDPDKMNAKFFIYYSQSSQYANAIEPLISGSTRQRISREKLGTIQIPLPSLKEQEVVVEKLDSAFAEIDSLEENLVLSDEKANQLLQSLLSSALSSTKGQNNFTKFFTVIPDSKSKIKSSSYLESGKYAVVDQGKELVAGYTDTSLTVDEKSLPVVVFGDHTRAVKYVDFPFTAGADGTQILKPSALTNPKYGFYLVLHAVGQIPSKGYARHFGELKKMQFQLPSLGEQRKVVEKLDIAFAEIEILKAQVNIKKDYATALRQSLLNSAFTQEEAFA